MEAELGGKIPKTAHCVASTTLSLTVITSIGLAKDKARAATREKACAGWAAAVEQAESPVVAKLRALLGTIGAIGMVLRLLRHWLLGLISHVWLLRLGHIVLR